MNGTFFCPCHLINIQGPDLIVVIQQGVDGFLQSHELVFSFSNALDAQVPHPGGCHGQ
jgi:hypothetical protein